MCCLTVLNKLSSGEAKFELPFENGYDFYKLAHPEKLQFLDAFWCSSGPYMVPKTTISLESDSRHD